MQKISEKQLSTLKVDKDHQVCMLMDREKSYYQKVFVIHQMIFFSISEGNHHSKKKKKGREKQTPTTLEALLACQLILQYQNPGLSAIAVGETLKRIIGSSAGSLQACAGHEAGWGAAVHAMIKIDVEYAFNSVQREEIYVQLLLHLL